MEVVTKIRDSILLDRTIWVHTTDHFNKRGCIGCRAVDHYLFVTEKAEKNVS